MNDFWMSCFFRELFIKKGFLPLFVKIVNIECLDFQYIILFLKLLLNIVSVFSRIIYYYFFEKKAVNILKQGNENPQRDDLYNKHRLKQ